MFRYFALIFCFVVFCLHKEIFGLRQFRSGRRSGGNVGSAGKQTEQFYAKLIEDNWLEQNLDHFDPTNTKTWKQRYYVNDEHYVEGGPVFLMIGGEGAATKSFMKEGAWIHYAKTYKALCFQLEHRYYGQSWPTKDMSTKNLLYLSSEQALADLAYFISKMNMKYKLNTNQKWIAFGGSYSGSLAAWLREKYPHLVYGAVSSSGPLLAKADFIEYFDVVTASLATYSQKCVDVVKASLGQIEILMKHMLGQRHLSDIFKLCDPLEKSINNPLDIANFFENVADNFAGVVQYNKDNRPNAEITIDTLCDVLVNETIGTPVTRLANINDLLLNSSKEKCLDYKYDKMINEMRNVTWNSSAGAGGRQWIYQTCTEFGFYQTAEDTDRVFGNHFDLNFFIKQCGDIYGDQFNADSVSKSIFRTNIYYGDLHPDSTNVIYVHGSIDPWHALGLTQSNDPKKPTIYIHGTAHCADMYEPNSKDIEELKNARDKISEFIGTLLK